MSVRIRTLALPLLLSVACTAASEPKATDEAEPAAEPRAEPAEESDDAPAGTKRIEIAASEPPVIALLEPGTNPETLRFRPTTGSEEAMVMTMRMNMKMGPTMPAVDMPPIVTSMRSIVDAVSDDRIEATVMFESMTVEAQPGTPPAVVDSMESALEGFESFRSSLKMNKRGALLGGTIDAPQGLPAPLQQTMNQMQESFGKLQVPLPEEAVGIGGRWRAVSKVAQGGMKLEQTATYEILERTDDTVKLAVELGQQVVDNTFEPPGMPGVTGTIDRYEGSGNGTLELQLDKLTPTRSDMNIIVDMKMTVEMFGQSQEQEMIMKVDVGLERGD